MPTIKENLQHCFSCHCKPICKIYNFSMIHTKACLSVKLIGNQQVKQKVQEELIKLNAKPKEREPAQPAEQLTMDILKDQQKHLDPKDHFTY